MPMMLIAVIVLTLFAVAGFSFLNRPLMIDFAGAIPRDFPAQGFSHASFEALLRRYVDADGHVDYQAWHSAKDHVAALGDYLAAVAAVSPDSHPDRFESDTDGLAYWLYAYNACVIRSVLANWPIASVTDVRAPIEAVKGLGFFYRQRFLFGGKRLSLYAVEHKKILAGYRDPRIHFVLNCASESCPALRPELPTGDALESLLQASTHDFIHDGRNVHIDHDVRRITLNMIFRWYRKDFVNALRRRGAPAGRGVLDYVAGEADPGLRAELDRAADYAVVYADYDWTINARENC